MRAALLALMVFVALVLGSIAGPGAFGDPQEKIDHKLDELDRIQSSTGSLREQIDAMNARVDDLIGRESVLRQQESALEAELAEKQAELDKATAELNAQKAELASEGGARSRRSPLWSNSSSGSTCRTTPI